jgi:hypothetical protein
MLLCKNCKYFAPDKGFSNREEQIRFGFCTHPSAEIAVSYHRGNVYNKSATTWRKDIRGCGSGARYYLDKDSIDPPRKEYRVFCTNCKYQRPNTNYYTVYDQNEYAFCTHPLSTIVDMVSGEHSYPFASKVRDKNDIRSCGSQGYMYEEREVTHVHNENSDSEEDDNMNRILIVAFIIILLIL